jgi:uncharacterized protein (TIGR02231 family)
VFSNSNKSCGLLLGEAQDALICVADDLQLLIDEEQWVQRIARASIVNSGSLREHDDDVMVEPGEVDLSRKRRSSSRRTDSNEMFDVVTRVSAHMRASKEARRKLLAKQKTLLANVTQLEQQISRLQNMHNVDVLLVTVDVEIPGMFALELKWVSHMASWAPSYDLSINTAAASAVGQFEQQQLTVQYFAVIQQSTGFDWEQVTVELSTGSVQRNQEPVPDLQPWRIDYVRNVQQATAQKQQERRRGFNPAAAASHRTASAMMHQFPGSDVDDGDAAAASNTAVGSPYPLVESIQSGISDVFRLKGTHSVPQETNPAHAVRVPVASML